MSNQVSAAAQSALDHLSTIANPTVADIRVALQQISYDIPTGATALLYSGGLTTEGGLKTNDIAVAMAGAVNGDQWRHGTDIREVLTASQENKPYDLTPPEVKEGELELWLVDLVVPHGTEANKLAQACLHDLLTGPLKGKKIKMQRTDAKTGEKSIIELGGE